MAAPQPGGGGSTAATAATNEPPPPPPPVYRAVVAEPRPTPAQLRAAIDAQGDDEQQRAAAVNARYDRKTHATGPLWAAHRLERWDLCAVLVEKGAEPRSFRSVSGGSFWPSPLTACVVYGGNVDSVRALLQQPGGTDAVNEPQDTGTSYDEDDDGLHPRKTWCTLAHVCLAPPLGEPEPRDPLPCDSLAPRLDALKLLVEEGGLDPHAPDSEGYPPLSWLGRAKSDHEEALALLLSFPGADVNARGLGGRGDTPLLAFLRQCRAPCPYALPVVLRLFAEGADVTTTNLADGASALHLAAAGGLVDVVRFLLQQQGVRVNARNAVTRETALHVASSPTQAEDSEEEAEDEGEDNDDDDSKGGETAATTTTTTTTGEGENDSETETETDSETDSGRAETHLALLDAAGAGAGALLRMRDAKGRTPLFGCAKKGDAAAVALLLERGASADVVDADGRTPLLDACGSRACFHDCSAAELLWEASSDETRRARDNFGSYNLLDAVVEAWSEAARAEGSDDPFFDLPEPHLAFLARVLEAGVSPQPAFARDLLPVALEAGISFDGLRHANLAAFLLYTDSPYWSELADCVAGVLDARDAHAAAANAAANAAAANAAANAANADNADNADATAAPPALCYRFDIDQGPPIVLVPADPDADADATAAPILYGDYDDDYGPPLVIAAARRLDDVLAILLSRTDVDVDETGMREDATALHAVMEDDVEGRYPNRNVPRARVIGMLLDAGADVDKVDGEGRTPLIKAMEVYDPDSALLLLERGADPNRADEYGTTPLLAAANRGFYGHALFGELVRHFNPNDHYYVYATLWRHWTRTLYESVDRARLLLPHLAALGAHFPEQHGAFTAQAMENVARLLPHAAWADAELADMRSRPWLAHYELVQLALDFQKLREAEAAVRRREARVRELEEKCRTLGIETGDAGEEDDDANDEEGLGAGGSEEEDGDEDE